MQMSSLSTEYVFVPVVSSYNPTAYDVAIAAIPQTLRPGDSDWLPATWETRGNSHLAKALIGPLPKAVYGAWVKVSADPEQFIALAGEIRVY